MKAQCRCVDVEEEQVTKKSGDIPLENCFV